MDIKLRARLSAYSKIESIQGLNDNTLPHPDAAAEGHVLGVGKDGEYTLFRRVTPEDMNEKWGHPQNPEVTSKEWIGTLFERPAESTDVINKEKIDELFEGSPEVVDVTNKESINTLFDNKTEEVDVTNKEEIDTLFESTTSNKGIVSHAAIDSLFDK